MNNDIKEILDDLLFTTTLPNVSIKLNKEKLNQLKDYITNLQHTKEYLGEVLHEQDLELEKLKTKMKEQSLLLIDYQDMEQKLEDYKSRVEKATEFINNYFVLGANSEYKRRLTDILNGKGSDE